MAGSAEVCTPTESTVDWHQLEVQFEPEPITVEGKLLTEVDQLNNQRQADGTISPWAREEHFKNLLSATKEAAMPYAVTKTEHDYQQIEGFPQGSFMWLGKTAVEHAMSGRRFHRHETALERVDIEIEEAWESSNLQQGVTKVFISPRMTRVDATLKEARSEHLGDDDAVRISEGVFDSNGDLQKRKMESLLFRDIPLEAWIDFLADPDNIFKKAISVERNGSATPVLEAHRELEIDSDQLENGVVSVVEAVVPYIQDQALQASAKTQLERFYDSQEDMHEKAVNIAQRWQDFEISLADSLHNKAATSEIAGFITSMQSKWGKEDLKLILEHQLPNNQYRMTRQLASRLEKAKQNLLWTRAGVVTGNEKVINQMDAQAAAQLYHDEMFIQTAHRNDNYNRDVRALEAQSDLTIADHNIAVGGGCAGENEGEFEKSPFDNSDNKLSTSDENSLNGEKDNDVGEITKGSCVVETCPTRPGQVKVGGCGVCIERCQKLYDKGKDPTKMTAIKQIVKNMVSSKVEKPSPTADKNHEFALTA